MLLRILGCGETATPDEGIQSKERMLLEEAVLGSGGHIGCVHTSTTYYYRNQIYSF